MIFLGGWDKFLAVVVVSLTVDVVVILIDIRFLWGSVRLSDLMYQITVLNWIISGILAGVTLPVPARFGLFGLLFRVIAAVVWAAVLVLVTIASPGIPIVAPGADDQEN